MPSPQRETANRLITAFNTLDTTTIIALRTPTCLRTILPTSLNHTPQSNDVYLANLNNMKSLFSSFHVTVTDLIEGVSDDDGKVKIVMYVSARGDTVVGEYRNEYVWKMGFEKGEGARIEEWSEYVDVGMVRDFYPRLIGEVRRRAAEMAKESKKEGEGAEAGVGEEGKRSS